MSQGVQPPQSQEVCASLGPQLLGNIRNLEAAATDSTASSAGAVDPAISSLRSLIAVASRQGIFQNDIAMAESLLMATSTVTTQGSHSKKRRSDDDHDSNGKLSATLPVQLVMTAVLRILSLNSHALEDPDVLLLISLAADLIRAVAQHAQASPDHPTCPPICLQAEIEWLQTSAKSLLTSMSQTKSVMLEKLQKQQSKDVAFELRQAVASCLYAGADLIGLAGTRLCRSQAMLSALETIVWDAMPFTDVSISAVSTVLAALPLAGGMDRATPASLWTKHLHNVQGLLWKLLEKSVPISQRARQTKDVSTSASMERLLDAWWAKLCQTELQEKRVELLIHLIRSLVSLLLHMIKQGQRCKTLIEAKVDLIPLLDLVDILLAVPITAEASYFVTKKRLRDECDSGILSPHSIAALLANHVYIEGHCLLFGLISHLGKASLLPYSQRLRQVGYASLLTSCSPTLRRVLEPGFVISKKRRWLPHSLVARSYGMKSLQAILTTFGVKAVSERAKGRRRSSIEEMTRVVKVVCGCLLEQLYPPDEEHLDWGTLGEKQVLVMACMDCLVSLLSSGGEFLALQDRQLIESVASTCLTDITQSSKNTVFRTAGIFEKTLDLGATCVSTSWPDGAASSLREVLRRAAQKMGDCGDVSLRRMAASVQTLCDTLSHPSVPALYIVTRQQEDQPMAVDLVAKIEQVRQEATIRKEQQAEEERQRKIAKLEKKQATASKSITQESGLVDKESTPTEQTQKRNDQQLTDVVSRAKMEAVAKAATQESQLMEREEADKSVQNPVETKVVPPTDKPVGTSLHTTKVEPKEDAESDLDEDFPMIVDAAPDEEDLDNED